MSNSNTESHRKRSRFVPLAWVSGGLAAILMVLGVSGTLSSWTTAIITNDTNTAKAADAVALAESDDGGVTNCVDTSTVTDGSNSATCSTINKYGGTATPLLPGGTSSVIDVTFTNTGNGDGTTFGYAPGTCADSTTPVGHLCSSGDLTVAVACVTGADFATGTAILLLANTAAAPSDLVDTTGAAVPIAAGDMVTCRITTSLISTAPATDAAMTVSQPIVWTLGA